MQALAIILLAAAAVATPVVENPQAKIGMTEASRLFKIYAAPESAREYFLRTDVEGVKAFFDKTVIVAYKNDKEINGFLLKGGFALLPENAEAGPFLHRLLSGEEKIGVTLSGINYLNMPQINLPWKMLFLPSDFNLKMLLHQYQAEPLIPVVFITTKQQIPGLDKLREMGEMTIKPDSTLITRDFPVASATMTVEAAKNIEAVKNIDAAKTVEAAKPVEAAKTVEAKNARISRSPKFKLFG